MKIMKSYKFRLYPNIEQKILINKTIGCTRFIYNYMLEKKIKNNKLSRFDLNNLIPSVCEEYPYLKEVDSMSLRCAIKDLSEGFNKYYNGKGGLPNYKKKGKKDSYRTNLITSIYKGKKYENIKLDLQKRIITLPKLKEIKIRGYRHLTNINGRIINVTIEQEVNKYYISVCVCEEYELPPKKEQTVVGIDIGVKSLVVTSNGETFGNPKYNQKYEKRIKRLQKSLSRKIKGSNNYKKNKILLARCYQKLRNARKKLVEKIVSKVTEYNDIIVCEKLKVKEMIEINKCLRKNIINSTFGLIITKIKDKCKYLNKEFIQVDTYYPSSQICSRCNNIDKGMKNLSKREYKCHKCGIEIERDLNASINIMDEGLITYYKKQYS